MQQVIKQATANANGISQEKKIYTIVVDGNSLIKSSLVNKTDINQKGEEYGAILLFLRRLGQLLQKKDFDHCIVCWDGYNSGLLRWELYKDYKANRDKNYELASEVSNPQTSYDKYIEEYCKKVIEYSNNRKKPVRRGETDDENFQRQRAILQEILEELFVRQYMYENVEGDDLVSYYCQNKDKNEYVVIVSEDRDLSQLIRPDICLYIPSKKVFVTPKNDIDILGMPAYNIVLKKIICGDVSDNIKGIKGIGEQTLEKYYPQILTEKATLEGFLGTCKTLLEERKAEKKKPVKCLENALNSITDGCQGTDVYDVNKKIIDLSQPLLTKEAEEELKEIFKAPIDPEGRSTNNIYAIVKREGMYNIFDYNKFGDLFGMYSRIRKKEIDYNQECNKR